MNHVDRTGLLNKLLARRTPRRASAAPAGVGRRLARSASLPPSAGPAGARVSPLAMVMRRAHWQGVAARHAHAHHHSWLVQAILRAGAPSAPNAGKGMLRMAERQGSAVQMITRVLQALPARMRMSTAAAGAVARSAGVSDAAPATRPAAVSAAASATVRRLGADGAGAAYPRVPMTMARSGGTAAGGAPSRPDTPAHLATVHEAGARHGQAARTASAFAAAPPVTLAPQELARVTDHVVTQLEQRALSYRERMGGRQ